MDSKKTLKISQIPWWKTDFSDEDIDMISTSIRHGHISQGEKTKEFENKLAKVLKVPHVIATSSGSTAILMACMALEIGEGDEVIVPNRTWIATAHAPRLLGAKVRVADVLPDKPIMDTSKVRNLITKKTKAIITVPLNGRSVEMDNIFQLAKEYDLKVIEDAAQGLLSKRNGLYMGTESDLGCFSLSMAKLLPTGQGGFVVAKSDELYKKLKRIRTHGVDDVINCNYQQMGFNFRYTDLQASIGIVQLKSIKARIKKMKQIYEMYKSFLKDISTIQLVPVRVNMGEVPLYIDVLCLQRDKLVEYLANNGIQTRPIYPNLEKAKHLNISGHFPNSQVYEEHGLVLPCGAGQSIENIENTIKILKHFTP